MAAKVVRDGKGKSIIAFPEKYVVVDIETTGLSPQQNEIIEISAIRYENGRKKDTFSTLIKPENEIPYFITRLTGISNKMVTGAPGIKEAVTDFMNYVSDDIIIGYNVNFDVNFIYDKLLENCSVKLGNDFVDVLRIARVLLTNLSSHKQTAVAEYYGLSTSGAHRAMKDCELCNAIFVQLQREMRSAGKTISDYFK